MINPFEKRATEFLRDAEAFLSVVSPEPLEAFFEKPARQGRLYDRLVMVIGSPGSGKTTLATLMQFHTIITLLRNADTPARRPLEAALTSCSALHDGSPKIIGVRLPLESGYRDFWEFPYSEDLKNGLLASLLQARAVLGWLRNIEESGAQLSDVTVSFKRGSEAAIGAIGGPTVQGMRQRAIEVEKAVYAVSAALVAPAEAAIPVTATAAYRPFDVIETIRLRHSTFQGTLQLKPLVMMDDAHVLHERQFAYLRRWLASRELAVARWLISRMDALSPSEILTESLSDSPVSEQAAPEAARDVTTINFQGIKSRGQMRSSFRKMALDMAGRYLRHLPIFERRQILELRSFLSNDPPHLSTGNLANLKESVDKLVKRNKVAEDRTTAFLKEAQDYATGSPNTDTGEDVQIAIMRILVNRYLKRIPQADFFLGESNPDPSKPIRANASIADGARIHLLHEYDRPYYFGCDAVCDASDENAELFLRFSGRLVSQAETRLMRDKPASLSVHDQHRLLVERAKEIVNDWAFPEVEYVRTLIERIANDCLEKSKEPNASLGGGPNAIGIPMEEFRELVKTNAKIARILQYAVGYNALTIVPEHSTKNRLWYLVELGGAAKLAYGLTLNRGGFLERSAADVVSWIGGNVA